MGPRPDGRGREQSVVAPPRIMVPLQWGRGRMAAEGNSLSSRRPESWCRFNGAAAGWPRKAVFMAGPPRGVLIASMRPRPDGRGRRRPRREAGRGRLASMAPRPDGRGRLRARERTGAGARGFNGAAAGWPRKDVKPHVLCVILIRASMGPRPDGRGRIYPLFVGIVMFPLQWGRGRMAAEGMYPPNTP